MSNERRQNIMAILSGGNRVTGAELAERLRVSRQVVVQDVALLRSQGQAILATPQGYCLDAEARPSGERTVLAVRHSPERTGEELHLMVGLGLKVLDVVIDHPLYGEMRGNLMLASHGDVDRFMERLTATEFSLLSTLTGGVHLHTVECQRASDIPQVQAALAQNGFLLTC